MVLALVVAFVVRSFALQSFHIASTSMEPTLQPGDRVLVSRLAYRWGDVQRGDVIVFDGEGSLVPASGPEPDGGPLEAAGRSVAEALGVSTGKDFVQRVVGLPGERVTCCDSEGRLSVDGVALVEPYLAVPDSASGMRLNAQVPAGRLWVMGDHRGKSVDSRAHLGSPGGGTVALDRVVGRVVAVFWPLDRFGGTGRSEARPTDSEEPL